MPQIAQSILRPFPGPVTDPGPEMWELIRALDQRVQLQVANIVLETQIVMARAHMEGLQKIQKALGGVKAPAVKPR
jgi:hypothetical protein